MKKDWEEERSVSRTGFRKSFIFVGSRLYMRMRYRIITWPPEKYRKKLFAMEEQLSQKREELEQALAELRRVQKSSTRLSLHQPVRLTFSHGWNMRETRDCEEKVERLQTRTSLIESHIEILRTVACSRND